MTATPPESPRPFTAPDGTAWEARIVASGRTSPYLASRLTRPLVEFRCPADPGRPRTYAPLRGATLAGLSAADLLALWSRARPY